MLPSLTAHDIEQGLGSYIRNEFPIASTGFCDEDGKSVIEKFLEIPGNLIKGPWVEVKMPFRSEASEALPFRFLDLSTIKKGFVPYRHQSKAFERLTGDAPLSTIIATGTGSGKTECFLYPIIDYCLSRAGKTGIKAILIYPMNALATDQEKRVSDLVAKIKKATGKTVRAGLYTGETTDDKRREFRKNPPDILLTNYKMLDFLLLRPDDQSLWRTDEPGMLRFLAVDELHTFDGAQGTDLACLIRRLRDRLKLGGQLTCIGTSATIGGSESMESLCRYASSIFGTEFRPEDVITEDRLSPAEYLGTFAEAAPLGHWPSDTALLQVRASARTPGEYFSQVLPIWFGETFGFSASGISDAARVKLGTALPRLNGFRRLVQDASGITAIEDLARKWAREIPEMRQAAPDPLECEAFARACAESLIAMVSEARSKKGGRVVPFLNVRVQLWVRTLSRAVVTVGSRPRLTLAADLPSQDAPLALPLVSCRECNQAAWAASIPGGPDKAGARVRPDLKLFYASWFSGHKDTALLYPVTDPDFYESHRKRMYSLCPGCGRIKSVMSQAWDDLPKPGTSEAACSCGASSPVIVWIPETTINSSEDSIRVLKFWNKCPHCDSEGSLRIFGAAASTLLAAAVDHLHSSPFSEDRKVIAFSDSVQDAAQRAGFLESRDFLPVCRHALVRQLPETFYTTLTSLLTNLASAWESKMIKRFDSMGRDAKMLGEAAFLATFMPPDKQWLHRWKVFSESAEKSHLDTRGENAALDVDELRNSWRYWQPLVAEVKERLSWEALMELGARSENGRTALRAGLAVAFPDPKRIASAAKALLPLLREQHGIGLNAKDDDLEKNCAYFLTGLLRRFKLAGAFDVKGLSRIGCPTIEADFGDFEEGRKSDFAAFNLSRVLPTFGRRYRAPDAVTLRADRADKFNIAAIARSPRKTWFQLWTEKLFTPLNPLLSTEDVLKDAFDVLTNAGLLRRFERKRADKTIPAWVMPLQHWQVGRSVRFWRCSCCKKRYFTASGASELLWQGIPCLTPGCTGHLTQVYEETPARHYDSDPVRINAEEHTSLVPEEKRHDIEQNFSTQSAPWSVNLLSATPTLEMGIDIGDLSTVVLCSMPPTISNYLQRIGRAGRRDGNALALTFSGKSTHEQFYWEEPREMLSGEVEPPGVFLRAVSVLERQLFAFALGRWVSETDPRPKLPANLKEAITHFSGPDKETSFPHTFLAWLEERADQLEHDFFRLFDGESGREELTEPVRAGLAAYLSGGGDRPSLARRLTDSLLHAREQLEDMQRKKKGILKRRNELRKLPEDEAVRSELSSLSEQSKAMDSLLKSSFGGKLFFNFLTDEGLLPNYAFPEEDVQVHSVIVKRHRKSEPQDSSDAADSDLQKVETFDFTRAAAAAIRELAPESSFYAQRHILRVDQLAISDDSFEQWRFCSECGHAERVALEEKPPEVCPCCGSPNFGDSGRVKTLIRTREVTAVADAKLDRITDDREERRYEPYADQVLVDVDRRDIDAAWSIADERFSFGFEFLKRVTVREINFGPVLGGETSPFRAGGKEFPQAGFKICRKCGKVWRRSREKADDGAVLPQKHDFSCPYYDKPDDQISPEDSPWVDGVFLYRELTSEAIRIRVPVCDMIDSGGADTGTSSLIAAIRLGLRRHFKGAVDHLCAVVATEPAKGASGATDRYIVIYDSIPGGSGYLKDLARIDPETGKPEEMLKMLRASLDAVANCPCAKDPEKDGCPRCVYQFRDFSPKESLSRRAAEKILRRICSYSPEQVKTVATVSDIPSFERSVLEELFIRKLQKLSESRGASFTAIPLKTGGERWEISVPLSDRARAAFDRDPGTRLTWSLTAQPDYKASRPSRPDFLIRPASEKIAAQHPDLASYIFADGWEFHAGILDDDTEKRQCIRNDGHRVWSVTWQDLADPKEGSTKPAGFGNRLFNPNTRDLTNAGKLWSYLKRPGSGEEKAAQLLSPERSSFAWLADWLFDPFGFAADMRQAVEFAALTQPIPKPQPGGKDPRLPAPLRVQATEGQKAYWCADFKNRTDFDFVTCLLTEGKETLVTAALRIDSGSFSRLSPDLLKADKALHEKWSAFWQCTNALQFMERSWSCTVGNENAVPFRIWYQPSDTVKPTVSAEIEEDAGWREFIAELSEDPELFKNTRKAAERLYASGAPAPDDLVDGFGSTVCCDNQGMLWNLNEKKIYLFPAEDLEKPLQPISEERLAVLTTEEPDWLEQLLKLLKPYEDKNK
jgi:DEAD/DEAH box helicase domain-containing protein